MNKLTRILSIVLAVLMVLPWGIGSVAATSISDGPISTEEIEFLIERLENEARDYVTRFINAAYLYTNEDFRAGTLLEVSDKIVAMGTAEITTDEKTSSVEDLQSNLQQFADVANYYLYTRSAQHIEREDFNLEFSEVETTISDDCATVNLYTLVSFRYPGVEDYSYCGNSYAVYFANLNNSWCIVDIYSEEMDAYGLTKDSFDVAEAVAEFDLALQANQLENTIVVDSSVELTPEEITPMYVATTVNSIPYSPVNATAYAYTYTTGSHTGSGNNTAYLNANFSDFSNQGGNCINFASQCVWAGFYGNDDPNYINKNVVPMDNVGAVLDLTDTANPDLWYVDSPSWKRCSRFLAYIQETSSSTLETGVKANIYTINANTNFTSISNATSKLPGAVVLTYHDTSDALPDHAIFITNADSPYYSGVRFCSNSPMRKNVALSDENDFTSHQLSVIIPSSFNTISTCSGHTYTSYTTDVAPSGYGTICSKCGYSKLTIKAISNRPVAAGTTVQITGHASVKCYRIAIAIAYENESASWTEYTNTSSASRTYNFSRAGLYTIKIAARDISDANSDSNGAVYTYKIRVY